MNPPPEPRRPVAATVPLGDSSADANEADTTSTHQATPTHIGRYVLEGELGAGGMGTVYRGFDPTLRRPVAIKVIGGSRARSASGRDRLVREAQALAALAHPNVVSVFEVGTFEGAVFIAMELVEGVTLGRWVKDEDRTWQEILEMFVQAGRGLEEAHSKGVIHRDFKPANVLVGLDGRPRVLDFGLATVDRETTPSPDPVEEMDVVAFADRLTVAGSVMGTPAYMAPEQAAGLDVTIKSDQFSFAVALWEALTGIRPFPGETMQEVQESILSGRRTAPSREAPHGVLKLLERGLEPDPSARWPSLGVLLDALDTKLERSSPLPWAITALGMLGLATAGAFAFGGGEEGCDAAAEWREAWGEERREALADAYADEDAQVHARVEKTLDVYGARWVQHYEAACASPRDDTFDRRIQCLQQRRDAIQGSVRVLIEGDRYVRRRGSPILRGVEQPEQCEGELAGPTHAIPHDPALAAEVSLLRRQISAARALLVAGKHEPALQAAIEALREATAVGFAPLVNEAQLVRGLTHSRIGQADEAEEQLSQAFWGATDQGDDAVAAEAAIELGWQIGYLQARYAEGVEWVRHFEAAQRRRGKDPNDEASLVLGPIYFGWDKLDLALPHLRRNLESATSDGNTHGIGIAHLNLGALYYELGLPQLARAEFLAARERFENSLPEARADLVLLAINHGGMELEIAHDIETARPLIEAGHRLALEQLGPEHPTTGLAHLKMGDLASFSGDLAAARRAFDEARAVAKLQKSATDELTVDLALASALHRAGKLDESEQVWRRMLTEAAVTLGSDHALHSAALLGLGQIDEARGDLAAARARYETALEAYHEESRSDVLRLRLALVSVLGKLDEHEEAIELANETAAWASETYGSDSARALEARIERAFARAALEREPAIATLRSLIGQPHERHAVNVARARAQLRLAQLVRVDAPRQARSLLEAAEPLVTLSMYPYERATLNPG